MAKTRMVNTRFWSDNFIAALSPLDRYMFLYFLTNEHTNIAGIYELPLKTVSAESGLKIPAIVKALEHLSQKIVYLEGWVCVKNFQRHQTGDNVKVKKGIENEMEKIPSRIKEKLDSLLQTDTLSIPYAYPSVYLNPNPDLNSNTNTNPNTDPAGASPAQIAQDFFSEGDSYQKMLLFLEGRIPREVVEQELRKFVAYWTEPNRSGTKVRWEQEKTFEIRRRLATWFNRVKDYKAGSINRGRGIA